MKKIASFTFVIGLFLILGEAGRSDVMMEMHQDYIFNAIKVIIGIVMMLPLPYLLSKEEEND